jgi:entericidin B
MKATYALLAVVLTVFSLSLAACNTVEGVGEDVRSAGDAIDDASEDARRPK